MFFLVYKSLKWTIWLLLFISFLCVIVKFLSFLNDEARKREERRLLSARRAIINDKYCIALCCDFCYPNMGGVEMHIYQLAQCLLRRGHKVIVVTHAYGERRGVRYMTGGLKTYYINHRAVYNGNTLPTVGLLLFPLLRDIFVRERVQLVHAHTAFSTIAHEAILYAQTMGLRTCFTDHSLFGFADASSILTNKVLKFSLSNVSHAVCVSHTSKENTCLRSLIDPERVSVIPNAVDAQDFTPATIEQRRQRVAGRSPRQRRRVTIVVISRLVYRKGVDLLVQCIPRICERHSHVDFLIAGDGDKRLDLEEMRERHQLEERVTMLGAVNHNEVHGVLTQGDIFLNCSLTEAFCIAIVEAVSSGLVAVSTNVGGIPEVLPDDMILLSRADADDLVAKTDEALDILEQRAALGLEEEQRVAEQSHRRVAQMYSWDTVAEHTERVYRRIMADPYDERVSLLERLQRVHRSGPVFGKIGCFALAVIYLYYVLLEWYHPRSEIDIVPRYDRGMNKKMRY